MITAMLQSADDHSNKEQLGVHRPTAFCAFGTLLSGISLYGLVAEFLTDGPPGRRCYVAIKALVHVYALFLVSLAFSISFMMRMSVAATSSTLLASAALVTFRQWQWPLTALGADVRAYMGCEEELQHLIELSANVASGFLGGWFTVAFYYFQHHPDEANDARLLVSKYFTFLTSVGASLLTVNAVPGNNHLMVCLQPAWKLVVLTCVLAGSVMATALVIAESKVGPYVALALIPEAIAFTAWCAQVVVALPGWLQTYGHGGEPAPFSFVGVPLTLLLALLLTFRAKDAGALSSLFDEAFVLFASADVVAAMGWRLLTQPPVPVNATAVQAPAKILAFFTWLLLFISVLFFIGAFMFGR